MLVVVEEFVEFVEATLTHVRVELGYNIKDVIFVVRSPTIVRFVMTFHTITMVWTSKSATPHNIIKVLKDIRICHFN